MNNRIRAREILVIGPNGESMGVIQLQDALNHARKHGLDLVEVSPKARPPVCKILDYGKYRYEMSKKNKESRRQGMAAKVKELTFRLNIEEHDYETKMRHAEGFLYKGMKTKLMLQLRGRQMQYQDQGVELMKRMQADLVHVAVADTEPKLVGRNINMMLTPLPQNKRSRKFTDEGYEGEEEDDALDNHLDDDSED